MTLEPILEVCHLSKSFGTHQVLRDVNFTVHPGDVTSILGSSGSGKSTLLRCINLLERPNQGEVRFHGRPITGRGTDASAYRTRVGMVFQSFNLFSNMNVLENCMAGPVKVLRRSREEARARALRYLEQVGMAPYINARPRQLSGGQKQRVAIARALATNPKVLLCDEATSALDPTTTRSILRLIQDINRRMGITAVIITHEMAVVEEICSHVAILERGRMVETGTVEAVFSNPQTEAGRRLVFPEGANIDKFPVAGVVRVVFNGGSSYEPLIASLAIDCGVKVNILGADTRNVNGKAFGSMLLGLPEDHGEATRAMSYLKAQKDVTVEEVPDYHG